jgi:hypothetical protein
MEGGREGGRERESEKVSERERASKRASERERHLFRIRRALPLLLLLSPIDILRRLLLLSPIVQTHSTKIAIITLLLLQSPIVLRRLLHCTSFIPDSANLLPLSDG